jgi:hypothetical protein
MHLFSRKSFQKDAHAIEHVDKREKPPISPIKKPGTSTSRALFTFATKVSKDKFLWHA